MKAKPPIRFDPDAIHRFGDKLFETQQECDVYKQNYFDELKKQEAK